MRTSLVIFWLSPSGCIALTDLLLYYQPMSLLTLLYSLITSKTISHASRVYLNYLGEAYNFSCEIQASKLFANRLVPTTMKVR